MVVTVVSPQDLLADVRAQARAVVVAEEALIAAQRSRDVALVRACAARSKQNQHVLSLRKIGEAAGLTHARVNRIRHDAEEAPRPRTNPRVLALKRGAGDKSAKRSHAQVRTHRR
ncbi:MAG TPA: hypothetical protein VKG38_08000 [Solirubrobacteraceae bacterium]|nr:hypothetical protein [Solirubrobacteraceae bacterium]